MGITRFLSTYKKLGDLKHRISLSRETTADGIISESPQALNTYYGTSSDSVQILNIHYAHLRELMQEVGLSLTLLLYCYT